jgi:hypothetical protein
MRTRCRPTSPQPDGPCPEERARGDTRSLASCVYPGYPAYWVRLSSGRTPSDTQADSVEACFGPGGLYAGPSGASTRLKGTADWLPLGTRASSHANRMLVTGIPERNITPSPHHPITVSQACDRILVSAWLKREALASARLTTRFLIASLKPVHRSVSFG